MGCQQGCRIKAQDSYKFDLSQASKTLAWVLANTKVKSTITGASHPDQIYESVRSSGVFQKLSPQLMAGIDGTLGNKYPVIKRRQVMP